MVEWFDDLKVGMRFKSESKTVSREEILRFASEFDPQPFHLDDEVAKDTILNGLAASGWHTAAISMRLALSAKPFGPHPLFGAGVDELRWMKPVRPDDTLHLEGEVVELIPVEDQAARCRAGQMDRVQPERRGGLYVQSDCDRAAPPGVKAERRVIFSGASHAAGRACGWNSRPFSTTSTTASDASVHRKNPVANGKSVPS